MRWPVPKPGDSPENRLKRRRPAAQGPGASNCRRMAEVAIPRGRFGRVPAWRRAPSFWPDKLGDAIRQTTFREPLHLGRAGTILRVLVRDRRRHRRWAFPARFAWRLELP